MIDPANQWALQIDVTNACIRECSNCTRFIGHHLNSFYMTIEEFEKAVSALKDFPIQSPPHSKIKNKVVGIIGGEPLLHPEFEQLCCIMESVIPCKENRGLWTGLNWIRTKYAKVIERVFGYINNNQHNSKCVHSPILISIQSAVQDPEERKKLIDNCWLQLLWSGSITPKGFFFCEVAAAFDILFKGPGGLPVVSECWRHPIIDFQEQINRWCLSCGIPLQLKGRLDSECIDDISVDNLMKLKDSERVKQGRYCLYTSSSAHDNTPWQYLK